MEIQELLKSAVKRIGFVSIPELSDYLRTHISKCGGHFLTEFNKNQLRAKLETLINDFDNFYKYYCDVGYKVRFGFSLMAPSTLESKYNLNLDFYVHLSVCGGCFGPIIKYKEHVKHTQMRRCPIIKNDSKKLTILRDDNGIAYIIKDGFFLGVYGREGIRFPWRYKNGIDYETEYWRAVVLARKHKIIGPFDILQMYFKEVFR
ncbi:MAG: hypothetical protein ACTSR3_22865 [Candidatus Helarchaeota archaeon]